MGRLLSEVGGVGRMAGAKTGALFLARAVSNLRRVRRDGCLAAVDAKMAGRRYKCNCLGATVNVDGAWFGVAREIYGRRTYFTPPGFTIGSGQTVIDLGANVGLFSVLAARLGGQVIAVEAQSQFLEIIASNLDANGCSADVMHGLVGGRSGIAAVPGMLEEGSHYRTSPPILSLDWLVANRKIDRIDFLKVDIEGSEFDLLARDLRWLGITVRIAMEVHPDFGSPAQLSSALHEHGFHTELRDNRLKSVNRIPSSGGYLYAWR
jgi:FkbM family methyltransferase